eukprot:TRINITY_DN35960_c0_g1_i1.p1 TRINITY_DN35960_c0_g1~~TRINITY_DN35960_c0_g1_i1.p1  ORF type:complete len:316 (-),score=45.34 TRINITY_DN35960_c0_g1_i1:25-972(-)
MSDKNSNDQLYTFDNKKLQEELSKRPWKSDPKHYKKVKIAANAAIKMVMHAVSGGIIEVMGSLIGRVSGDTMIVTDSFALPVEGTETRVNAGAEGYEYMVQYLTDSKATGRPENLLGWYHSHPGYGCWLSGIDVGTTKLNQQYQEPYLAIVVDPVKTVSSGKVELGAFRCYPEGYKPEGSESEWQSIPQDKIEDFGVHANQYYSLDVSYYKSSLDSKILELLWNKYWVNTLSSNVLVANRDYASKQIDDISRKLEKAESGLAQSRHMGGYSPDKKKESELQKVNRDSQKVSIEQVTGTMNLIMKDSLFNLSRKKI